MPPCNLPFCFHQIWNYYHIALYEKDYTCKPRKLRIISPRCTCELRKPRKPGPTALSWSFFQNPYAILPVWKGNSEEPRQGVPVDQENSGNLAYVQLRLKKLRKSRPNLGFFWDWYTTSPAGQCKSEKPEAEFRRVRTRLLAAIDT